MKRSAWIGVLMGLLVPMLGLVVEGAEGLPEFNLRKIVLEPPSAVTRGEVVTVRAWVINTGERPAGEFKAEFFYRLKSEGESWKSFHTVLIPNLPPSQQDALEIKDDGHTIALDTSTLELGAYEIRVVADSNNQIPEGDEMNNELTTTLTLLPSRAGLPDLQPVFVAFDPPSPASGELIVVSCEVRNTGAKDAGPFRVAFLVDGREFDGTSLETLPAGASVAAQGALDPYALGLGPGSHTVRVRVDSGTQLEEQDEANNELVASLSIQGAELRPLGLEFDRSLVRLDERVTVSSRIKNAGRGGAEAVEVAFFVGGVPFALASLGPLGPGDEAIAQGELVPSRLDLGLVPGAHEVRVVVDPHNLIPELDEANNELVKSLTIFAEEPKLAELHPESLELNLPSPVELGKADAVTVSSVITNTGKAQASGFGVEFGWRVKGTLRWEAVPCRDPAGCGGLILVPGAELKVEGTLPVSTALPGIYEVRVVVDPHEGCDLLSCSDVGNVAEVDETNNALATTLTLLSPRLPDLTVDPSSPLEVTPVSPVRRGQTLRVLANLTNLGDTDAGPFEVEFSYAYIPQPSASGVAPLGITAEPSSCTRFAAVSLRGLAVGKKVQVQGLLETIDLRPGNYLIRVTIDPALPDRAAGAVREKVETNNILEVLIVVQGPDLAPVSLDLAPASPVAQGDPVVLRAAVVNLGVEPAGRFHVAFSWCKVTAKPGYAPEVTCATVGTVSFPGIAVATPEPAEWTLDTSALEPGEYLVRVVVDPEDAVEEQDEQNNELAAPLVVISPPSAIDLVPRRFSIDSAWSRWNANVMVWITNQGEDAAGPFLVQFFYEPRGRMGTAQGPVLFYTAEVSGLVAGETTILQRALSTLPLSRGEYLITVVVDPTNQVREQNEENNRTSQVVRLNEDDN